MGRVLDPAGNPVMRAAVELLGRARVVVTRGDWSSSEVLLGRGETDAEGRFRIDAARTSSVRYFFVHALVKAPMLGWAEINPDAQQPAAEVRLQPEQVIRGKLVDVNGQPAAGVELRPAHFGQVANVGQGVDVVLEGTRPEGLKAWPEPVKTDDQGRFVFKGLSRGLYVNLAVDDRPVCAAVTAYRGRRSRGPRRGHAGTPAREDDRRACRYRRHRATSARHGGHG